VAPRQAPDRRFMNVTRKGTTKPVGFANPAAFRAWLRANHRAAEELLVRIAKAGSARPGITYGEALDEALCYGWIDGVRRRIDGESFSIRFSPRKPRSIWSRINVAHAERLQREGKMTKAGLVAFTAREERRTVVYSFEQPPKALPPAYRRAFRAHPAAWTWFQRQAPWYRRTTTHWVVSARQEATRLRRVEQLIECSGRQEPTGPVRRKS